MTIQAIISRFSSSSSVESSTFNETQARTDFFDPLWSELGWDVQNSSQHLQSYREVVAEFRVSERGVRRRADYLFRLDREPKFIVEVKKPSVDISRPEYVYQAKMYAWCARVPVTVLTNFHQWSTYVLQKPPDLNFPLVGHRADWSYSGLDGTQVPSLLGRFSRTSVADGSLIDLVRSANVSPESRHAVDHAFIDTLMDVRLAVARMLVNSVDFDDALIDQLTQVLINRLLFLRVTEDRYIRLGNFSLRKLINEPDDRLCSEVKQVFQYMRTAYNGELFQHSEIDDVTLDASKLRCILEGFVPPQLPYRLDAFPDDFLGNVYERYLSVQIVTDHQSGTIFRPCPERIRSKGAHYTPSAVVRYMINESVGRWLWKGSVPSMSQRAHGELKDLVWRSRSAVASFRILDPSCGSGAFLIGALDVLIDWYLEKGRWKDWDLTEREKRDWYIRDGDGKIVDATPMLKAHIVKSHLFGIDIDKRAVDVARVSLYLRIMENNGLLLPQLTLPNLDANLKWGNTLVSPEYLPRLDPNIILETHPFDPSGLHGFREAFEDGGFDVVIGNPPYVFGEHISSLERDAYTKIEFGRSGQRDLFKLFYARTISTYLKEGGIHSFIVPDAILARDDHDDLRTWLGERLKFHSMCHVGKVFRAWEVDIDGHAKSPRPVGVSAVVINGAKQRAHSSHVTIIHETYDSRSSKRELRQELITGADVWAIAAPESWFGPDGLRVSIDNASVPLGSYLAPSTYGITRGEEIGKSKLKNEQPNVHAGWTPIYAGSDVFRHFALRPSRYTKAESVSKDPRYYSGPKILFVKTGAGPVAAAVSDNFPTLQSVYVLHLAQDTMFDPRHIAALMTSAIVTAYSFYRWTFGKLLQPQFTIGNVKELPIPHPESIRAGASELDDALTGIINLIDAAKSSPNVPALRIAVAEAEERLDRLISGLYGLDWDCIRPHLLHAFSRLPESQRPRWYDGG